MNNEKRLLVSATLKKMYRNNHCSCFVISGVQKAVHQVRAVYNSLLRQ
jgi:hypothetical protein